LKAEPQPQRTSEMVHNCFASVRNESWLQPLAHLQSFLLLLWDGPSRHCLIIKTTGSFEILVKEKIQKNCLCNHTKKSDKRPGDVESFPRFDQAMVSMFWTAAGLGLPDSVAVKNSDGSTDYWVLLFFASYILVINWTLLQVRYHHT
jgi:hypothetical protein